MYAAYYIKLRKLDLLLVAQFDIFCINETWLNESVLYSELEVIGYSALSKHRTRHGGGILIYVNDKLDCIRRCDLEIIDLECVDRNQD